MTLQVLAFFSFIKHCLIQTLGLYIYFKYLGILYKLLKLWVCILLYAGLHVHGEHAAVLISVTWWAHSKYLFSVSYDPWNENFSHIVSIWRLLLFSVHWVLGEHSAGSRAKSTEWGGKQGEEERQYQCKSHIIFLFLNSSVPQGFDIGTWNLARIYPWGLRNAFHCLEEKKYGRIMSHKVSVPFCIHGRICRMFCYLLLDHAFMPVMHTCRLL